VHPVITAVLILLPAGMLVPDTLCSARSRTALELSSLSSDKARTDRWLAMDKFWHLSASFVTVGASYHLCADRLGVPERMSAGAALGGTVALGLTKEFCDLGGDSKHFSWKDLAADAAGIALGYFVFIHHF
jgi:uncharacterized protein YfiM (DUF2279 family)